MQRSPPKYPSNPDLSTFSNEAYINTRKRKQFDGNHAGTVLMDHNLDKKLSEMVTSSVQTVMTAEVNKILTAISGLSADNASIKDSLKECNTRLGDIDKALNAVDERQNSFDMRLKTLEENVGEYCSGTEKILMLENKLSIMEQQARENNIEISNIPERRGENLLSIITNLGGLVNYKISPNDITSLHRVPHANMKDSRPKNIILKLASRITRDNLIAAYRTKKGITSEQLSITGPPHKIYVNEHLTLQNKNLFRETREKAKIREYRYVWVKHGVILARKNDTSPVIAVRALHDIKKLN